VPNSPSSFATFTKPIVDVKVVDPHTLVFKTDTPHVLLPSDVARATSCPRRHGEKAATEDYNSGKAAIGTGPYKFAEYIPNQRVVMKANYGYWGGEEPWDKVTFKILTNSAAPRRRAPVGRRADDRDGSHLGHRQALAGQALRARRQGLQPGDLRAPEPVGRQEGALRDRQGRQAARQEPFKDARVRKALSMAINRDAIADRIMEKKACPPRSCSRVVLRHQQEAEASKYDPEGAKKLLAEAGYPNGFAITIHGTNNRYINDDKIARRSRSSIRAAGIDAKVETMPSAVYFTKATNGEYGYMLLGWGTESGEQGSSLRSLLATRDPAKGMGVNNRGRYSNPAFDKLLTDALVTMDEKKREAMIQPRPSVHERRGPHPDPLRGEHLGHAEGFQVHRQDGPVHAGDRPEAGQVDPAAPKPRSGGVFMRAGSALCDNRFPMLAFAIRRFGQSLFVLVVMSFLVFLGVYAIGNPIELLVNPQADEIERRARDRRARPGQADPRAVLSPSSARAARATWASRSSSTSPRSS
jgi:hypothetical protein